VILSIFFLFVSILKENWLQRRLGSGKNYEEISVLLKDSMIGLLCEDSRMKATVIGREKTVESEQI
jgi:hypothetical protein